MYNESSLLMIYLFSSANLEQRQNQQKRPVEEKNNGISAGFLTHAASLTIGRNSFNRNTNPDEFCKRIEKAKHIFKQKSHQGAPRTRKERMHHNAKNAPSKRSRETPETEQRDLRYPWVMWTPWSGKKIFKK